MTHQVTDKSCVIHSSRKCLLLASAALIFMPASLSAAEQNAAKPGQTPALVVPAEEATKDVAPTTKDSSSNILSTDQPDDGSLAGDFLSSYVAHSQGDVTSAIKYLKESLAKDPANTTLAGQLLILELMHGEMNDAIVLAKKLNTYKDHELIVDLLLAVDATKKHDLVKASKQLNLAKSNSFDHIWLPLLSAWLDPTPAKSPLMPDAIMSDKGDVPSFVFYHVALINQQRGFKDEARKQLQASIKDLSRAPFRALLAYTENRASDNDRETIQQMLIDLDQQRPDMAELLRRELPYLRNLSGANPLPSAQLVSDPEEGVSEVLLTMASMLYTLDTSQDIPLYLQLALYLKPDFPTAQLMLGNYYETLELYPEALLQYQKIRPTSPLYIKAGIRRAYIAEMQKKPEQAEEILHGFLRQFPDSLEIIMAMGDMLRNRGDYAGAIPYYDKAIKRAANMPSDDQWVLYFARGACFERMQDYTRAEADLQQSLKLTPDQPEVNNYLGYMWLDQDKNVEEALKLIQKAYDASPNQPHIIDSLGWAYVMTGKLDEGIALLENAAEMMPNDPTINEHLGDAYWFAERELEAKFEWQRALNYLEDQTHRPILENKIKNGLTTYSFYKLAKQPSKPSPSNINKPANKSAEKPALPAADEKNKASSGDEEMP